MRKKEMNSKGIKELEMCGWLARWTKEEGVGWGKGRNKENTVILSIGDLKNK